MSTKQIAAAIELMKKNLDARHEIMKVAVASEYDKRYRICESEESPDCEGVSLAIHFHGKKCGTCRSWYLKKMHANRSQAKKKAIDSEEE